MQTLGIAVGIATVGWAMLDTNTTALTILAAGVWSFDTPETPKTHTPTTAIRQGHRGTRRTTSRRRVRMNALRRLFHDAHMLPSAASDALSLPALDPWTLRAAALFRRLTGPELAAALGHIARHRAFRSNANRRERGNEASETSRMMKSLAAMQERLQRYRTAGLMFATDPEFAARKRNTGGEFTRSILRADLEHETRQIFAEQRRLGSPFATVEMEAAYTSLAFDQRPMPDSEQLVGACLFESGEKRTARRSYAFEMFRLLSRLANLTLSIDGRRTRLDAAAIRKISADFGITKRITYRAIRDTLGIDERDHFVGIAAKSEGNDVVARQGDAAEGTYTLRRVVGEDGWLVLMRRPLLRDRIAEVLTWRHDTASIRAGLAEAGASGTLLDDLMAGVEGGAFADFAGTGHLSAKAARALFPALRRGLGYAAACDAAGYDHGAAARVALDDLHNGVARKSVTEAIKQISAILREHGQPDAIHIGLMRDVGKSAEERDEISRGIERANKRREAARNQLEELLGRSTARGELLRYELWKEQGGRCLYTDTYIDPTWLAAGDNIVMVGHILPWSRFGDDSFFNKTLCLVSAGQAKRDRTPWEWFDAKGLDWNAFTARVEACRDMKGGKKGGFYLRKNAAEIEEDFRNRHLSDTRYIARFLKQYLGQTQPNLPVRARASQLTDKLRRAWGLDDLKHDADGERKSDDRHRAVDAIVLASITERAIEDLTIAAREAERLGSPRGFDFSQVEPPAEGFREVVREVIAGIFPARAERRRVDGELHAMTMKRISMASGVPVVSERRPVEKLTLTDLDRIPPPEPHGPVRDLAKLRDGMTANLRDWIERGSPKDDPPRSPKGDIIRKVRVLTGEEIRVPLRGSTVDRGRIARVDVFRKLAKGGAARHFLVPVYPHQIADPAAWPRPPAHAIVTGKPESQWVLMNDADFRFSLFPHSLIEVVKPDGEVIRGYFKGVDRTTGAIAITDPTDMGAAPLRTGVKFLLGFEKLRVDRLGRIARVRGEVRTWRGAACI